MIKEKFKPVEYYQNLLSKYMRESYGMNDNVEVIHTLLTAIDETCDLLYQSINIFDENYNSENYAFSIDSLGAYFGIKRQLIINNEVFTLTNKEMIMLIKVQIIRNNYSGTREDLNYLYSLLNLTIKYVNTSSCHVSIYLITADFDEDEKQRFITLFENGYLTIESSGINYIYEEIESLSSIAKFDDVSVNRAFDMGVFI